MEVAQAEPVVVGVMSRCIDDCLDCRRECLATAAQLLSGGAGNHSAVVGRLWDCADLCGTHAGLMLRSSALIGRTCETCAEICESSAVECERHADDPRLQACALVCRRCAASCRDTADLHRNRRPL